MPTQGLLSLRRVGSLLLQLPPLMASQRHMLNTVYQHLYQEVGMVGYHWAPGAGSAAETGAAGSSGVEAALSAVVDAGGLPGDGRQAARQARRQRRGPTGRRLQQERAGRMPMHEHLLPALQLGFARVL